jgi:hypothetical protein
VTRLLPAATAFAVLAVLATGCGSMTAVGSTGPGDSDVPDIQTPPPVEIAYDGGSASLEPWTFCYANGCADGAPPEEPHFVGSPAEVRVSYPLDRWMFSVDFTPAGERCGRHQYVELEPGPHGVTVVRPLGPAGTYDVNLSGAQEGGGDLVTTFRWETPTTGELPLPKARAAVLADHDGELDSYGVELDISNLATTPRKAEATIEVRDETGRTVSLQPRRQRGCVPDGSVWWRLGDKATREATTLTGDTFRYRVVVTLDGTEHVATATWPDDVVPGNEPSVDLEFAPPLPAMTR